MTNTRLHVAHVITQLELGGAQRNTLYTVSHLDRERFGPTLICGVGGILDPETEKTNYRAIRLRALVRAVNPVLDFMAVVLLYRIFRESKPHIVHTHSSKAGILGRIAAYLAGVPVIIHTFHGFGFTPGQPKLVRALFVAAEKLCAWFSTHLVFVSEDNRQEAVALGIRGAKPASLIRSGIQIPADQPVPEHQSIRHELGIPKDAWLVASVGNFKPQKNPMDLARVAYEVLKTKPETRFVFVGGGEGRAKVEAWCQEHGIYSQTHFLGWRHDVASILADSDAFLLTSLWEGLPRALVEAFAAGRPAVAYAVNGVKDILKDGENGFAVPAGEVATAAEKIVWLQENPQDARRYGQAARERVVQEFDIDEMVRKQEALYDQLWGRVPLKAAYEPIWNESRRVS